MVKLTQAQDDILVQVHCDHVSPSNHQLPSSASNLVGLQLRLATGSFDDSFDAGTGMLCCVVSSKIKIPKTLSR